MTTARFSRPFAQISGLATAFAIITIAPSVASARPQTPEWLKQPLSESIEHLSAGEDAVRIVDSEFIRVTQDGDIEHEVRQAVRILTKSGAEEAKAYIWYDTKADKVSDVHAWLIYPNGKIDEYRDKDFTSKESSNYAKLFSETWLRSLNLSSSAIPGSVFVWTYKLREQTIFSQKIWSFRSSIPNLRSTISIALPKDWRVSVTPVNNPEFTYSTTGSTYQWEATNQQAIQHEAMCERGKQTPYIGINIYPSERDKNRTRLTTFEDWQSVSSFDASLNDTQIIPNDDIRTKVAELTKNCDSQWKKIQTVCRYAQSINYISINTNLSKGGGYKPFPAATVFARNYGDCKDKAALLRSMLSCLGVESYAVSCMSDDENAVSPEWPSPYNFNHCIVAMKAPEGVETSANVSHPDLGQLMIFDPTDDTVPVGYIPNILANSYFLVSSSKCKSLAKFPDRNSKIQIDLVANIDATGRVIGSFKELDNGAPAVELRCAYKYLSHEDFALNITEWLRQQTRDTKLVEWNVSDDFDANEFRLNLTLDAANYSRPIGARKLLFKAFINRAPSYVPEEPTDGKRKTSFVIEAYELVRNSSITLPEGFTVDELPKDISLNDEFGSVELHSKIEGNVVKMQLVIKQDNKLMPPEAYERFRKFRKSINKAIQSTIVIRRL